MTRGAPAKCTPCWAANPMSVPKPDAMVAGISFAAQCRSTWAARTGSVWTSDGCSVCVDMTASSWVLGACAPQVADHLVDQLGGEEIGCVQAGNRRQLDDIGGVHGALAEDPPQQLQDGI